MQLELNWCAWKCPTPNPQWYRMSISWSENLWYGLASSQCQAYDRVTKPTGRHSIVGSLWNPWHNVMNPPLFLSVYPSQRQEEYDNLVTHRRDPQSQMSCPRA